MMNVLALHEKTAKFVFHQNDMKWIKALSHSYGDAADWSGNGGNRYPYR